jgi:hypothetical protein
MNMKHVVLFLCLVSIGVVAAQSYTDWQQGAREGLSLGFKMGQAYEKAQNGLNINEYNTLVDSYNAWVKENFGEDSSMLAQKITTPSDLTKPILMINNSNSTGGIVHEMDGGSAKGPTYTTNDMNLLPGDISRYNLEQGGQYLPGV